jgi:3-methyladenine DNA glycosylase AlkD
MQSNNASSDFAKNIQKVQYYAIFVASRWETTDICRQNILCRKTILTPA